MVSATRTKSPATPSSPADVPWVHAQLAESAIAADGAGGLRLVPVSDLSADPSNVRRHGSKNHETTRASLRRFGQRLPIVVQQQGLIVRAGNDRLTIFREEGWTHIAALVVDESDVAATSFAIADNRSSELAEWDEDGLARQLEALLKDGINLDDLGFDASDLGELDIGVLDEPSGELVDPGAGPPPLVATTRPGDLWILGNHRLLCGDSSIDADVDRLTQGEPVHLVNTDPPYNVRVEPRTKNAIAAGSKGKGGITHHQKLDLARDPSKARPNGPMRARDRELENDFISPEAFDRLLRAWFNNVQRVLIPGGAFYIWGGYANLMNYPDALRECSDLYFSQAIIWVKHHPVLTRKDFMGDHEWAFYGWKKGHAHRWFGPNNERDVWEVKKVNPASMVHLTEKPVELAERAMLNSSEKGDRVVDFFGGSGSTLMAGESLSRSCLLIEKDGPYCDVIVNRWQTATGKTAILDGDGRTFEEIAAERLSDVDDESTNDDGSA